MNVIAIDDEKLLLEDMLDMLSEIDCIKQAKGFCYPEEALAYIMQNPVDIVFCDILMYEESGIEVAKKIKEINPEIFIIFTTAHSEFALDAIKMRADAYLLKPISIEELRQEVYYVKNKGMSRIKKLKIQTFGNFEVFNGSVPIYFKRSKAKELLAYLVDRRGASVNMAEICTVLWEDRLDDESLRSLLRHVISCLISTLTKCGYGDVIVKQRNSISIVVEKVDCDFYEFLEQKKNKKSYLGEYMINYSWAEYTRGIMEEDIY